MDQKRFESLTRSLARVPSRRDVLRGLAGAGLGLGLARIPDAVAAKKRRKRKGKKAKPNQFGCLDVGVACKNADQCCSGVCGGKKGKRKCRAHDTGTCIQDIPDACDPDNPLIAVCNSDVCLCSRSTAGSIVCINANIGDCADCRKDADCEALGWPAGTACIPMTGGYCDGLCEETGMACRPPCGVELPEPLASRRLMMTTDGAAI